MGMTNPVVNNNDVQIKKEWSEQGKIESRGKVFWKRYRRNKLAVTGLWIFGFFAVIAILAPWISPHDALGFDLLDSNLPPSWSHPFGTDPLGGDVMSRVFYGARVSLIVGIVAMIMTVSIGVIYGAISGYFGGGVDNVMMRIVDAISSIPSLFLLLMIASLMQPSVWTTILVISIVGWTGMSRIVRGEILTLKRRDFIEAAKASGELKPSIIFYHILPNAIAPITVIATIDVAANILAEASLSFLGLGIQPPTPSWGNMIAQAQDLTTMLMYPWTLIFPATFIVICILSISFIGDGVRDALDPKMKQ